MAHQRRKKRFCPLIKQKHCKSNKFLSKNAYLCTIKIKNEEVHTKEEKLKAFGRLLDVQDRLRKECPWDRKQTFDSLRPNTIEEVYELCDAILKKDKKDICKELGDVMEHVVFYALLGSETGDFDIADVCNAQADKLMYRHDFINWKEGGDWYVTDPELTIDEDGIVRNKQNTQDASATATPQTASQVELTWEQRKQTEHDGNKTVLSGVPESLPTLIKAYRIQDKARNVGFDWKKKEDVWDKVREELSELEAELNKGDKEHATEELGDYLFSLINAARLYHLNPDTALEETNQKFIRRFNHVEQRLKSQGRTFKDATLEEMDSYWDESKKTEDNNR